MTKQASFSELEYAAKKKQTRRDRFLAEIEAVTPWAELERTITPFYPSSGGRGCRWRTDRNHIDAVQSKRGVDQIGYLEHRQITIPAVERSNDGCGTGGKCGC